KVPAGWGAEGAKDGHVVIHSADRTVFAVLQPFKLPQGGSASQTIGPLIQHMTTLFPEARVLQQQDVSAQPDEVIASVSFRWTGRPARATVLSYVNAGAGRLYAIAAPEPVFAAKKPTLVKVVNSFQYTAEAAKGAGQPQSAGGPLVYTAWTEPRESAFTVQI